MVIEAQRPGGGPLAGVRIVELAGIGPGPFAAMMLADMGAEVLRVDRADAVNADEARWDVLLRGRRSIAVDLKNPAGIETVLRLIEGADGLIEGFRPGVMERLGLSPEVCLQRNPRLVFGRITGWGQDGPYAPTAGHDINFIALAGALAHIGRRDAPPTPPLNLVGDFGGGGMLLAFGVMCALFEAQRSGAGQVIDAAMVDGTAALMATYWAYRADANFDESARGGNILDSGAHFYDVYRCADGEYVSFGSVEDRFYAQLLQLLGLDGDDRFVDRWNADAWPDLSSRVAEVIVTRTRAEWCAVFEGTDVCFAPVLTMTDAAAHPHNVARQTFVEEFGVVQPAPAPRFSRTPGSIGSPPPLPGEHTREVLADWGWEADEIARLLEGGAIGARPVKV